VSTACSVSSVPCSRRDRVVERTTPDRQVARSIRTFLTKHTLLLPRALLLPRWGRRYLGTEWGFRVLGGARARTRRALHTFTRARCGKLARRHGETGAMFINIG
jgi:hypothetical protein